MLTRRQFLACSALAVVQPPQTPVRVVVRGSGAGCRGAALALEEMERTAALVGRALDPAPHPAAMVIDIGARSLMSGGETFHVAASDAARRRAIDAFRPERPGSPPRNAIEWHPDLTRFGAEQLNTRYERRFGHRMTAAEWLGWMAVKAAVDAQLRPVPLARGRFDGHKGVALYFGPDRRLVQPLYVVDSAGTLLGTSDQV